jgi:hypothetical protein
VQLICHNRKSPTAAQKETAMPWFVASRPLIREGQALDTNEFRVFSEEEIESIGPEWDWASSVFDSKAEALIEADELFWDNFD